VLIHHRAPVDGADLVLRLPTRALPAILGGRMEGIDLAGDPTVLQRLLGVLDAGDPAFEIVRP
jgi:alkyl sulfatase BDS1-like metallo-beta-lactamase superfamily hydrolase